MADILDPITTLTETILPHGADIFIRTTRQTPRPLRCSESPKLFLVDDLGWRDLGCYGSSLYETPYIDRFAGHTLKYWGPSTNWSETTTFGFVSKYKKEATVPTGNTQFQFKAGDLNSNRERGRVSKGGWNSSRHSASIRITECLGLRTLSSMRKLLWVGSTDASKRNERSCWPSTYLVALFIHLSQIQRGHFSSAAVNGDPSLYDARPQPSLHLGRFATDLFKHGVRCFRDIRRNVRVRALQIMSGL